MTIESLLAEQNELLRRIADGVDRLVALADTDGTVSAAPAAAGIVAVPLGGAGKYHAQLPSPLAARTVGCRADISSRHRVDMSNQVPAHQVPKDRRCRHDGCWSLFERADQAAATHTKNTKTPQSDN